MNKQKIFELSWEWYDDYMSHLFYHPKKTKKEFKKDVRTLLRKYGEEYIQGTKHWVGAHDWIQYISTKMPDLGYQPIEPVRETFFGAYILKDEDKEKEWKSIVGKKLFFLAISKNKEIERKLDKTLKKFNKKNGFDVLY